MWKAVTGTIATVATILICYLLYLHGESLLNAAHVYCWERLLTAGRGLFERAATERRTTAVASHKNCSDDETTSLGTTENYSLPQTFWEQPDFL